MSACSPYPICGHSLKKVTAVYYRKPGKGMALRRKRRSQAHRPKGARDAVSATYALPSIGPRTSALVISRGSPASGIVLLAMSHFPQPDASRRAPRVHLNGSIAAAIRVEGGRNARAKLQSISVTGGLLQLQSELSTGDFVEIAFQTRSGPIHAMAEMLQPVRRAKAQSACLQAFRFVALEDQDHNKLSAAMDSALDGGGLDPGSYQAKSSSL